MVRGKIETCENEYAMVKIERQDMCGACHACEMTGAKKTCELRCLNPSQVQIGEEVEVDLSQNLFIKATAIMYGVPLLGLLLGLGLGMFIPESYGTYMQEVGMLLLGGLFMGLGLLWIKHRDKKEKYRELIPVIKGVVKDKKGAEML